MIGMTLKRKRPAFALALLLLMTAATVAQDAISDACAALVERSITQIEEQCADIGAGEACYGSADIAVTPADVASTFADAGDRIALNTINALTSSAVDTDEWGAAVLRLADGATLYVLGDVQLSNISEDALSFATGAESLDCEGAVNTLLLRSAPDAPATLTLNDVQIAMAEDSALVLEAAAGARMTVILMTGNAEVTAADVTETLSSGELTIIPLGGAQGLVANSMPTALTRFDGDLLQFVPLRLIIDDIVAIPSDERWVPSGVTLSKGDIFLLQATEFSNTGQDLPWATAEGLSSVDCAAAGRTEWDCGCRSDEAFGTCSLDEVPSMALVGRIGDGLPFVAGAGGVFRAQVEGELFLGVNDNTFSDNNGTYYVYIDVILSVDAGE